MSSTDETVRDEKPVDPQEGEPTEDDNNQPQEEEDAEQVTNMRLYLIKAMRMKKLDEMAEFVLYKHVLEQVEKMDPMPSSAWDVIHSKEKMVEELTGLKEKHLRNHYLFDQLLGLMLNSPDTDEEVTSTLPPISHPVYYTSDGKKYYR
jgi:hypothetical protein